MCIVLEIEYSQTKVRANLEKLTPAAIMQTFTKKQAIHDHESYRL